MSYRRNITTPRKDIRAIPPFDYTQLFLRMHYSGELNRSFIRLLACLDFKPALNLIYESEGRRQTRFSKQFPLIDFNELDQVIPGFSNYFVVKTVNTLYFLIKKLVLASEARIDVKGHRSLKYIGRYLKEYEFYPEACHQVIKNLNYELDELQIALRTGISVFGLEPEDLISKRGSDLMVFVEDILDYLNKVCGECPGCEVYHGRETTDFSRPLAEFQRDLVYNAFQLARKYRKGRTLKKRLITYVFDALQKPSIHTLLQRSPVAEKVRKREQRLRQLPFRENPYSDDELVVTALQNLANASEYSDRGVYEAAIDALHNAGPPEAILEAKVVALTRLLNQAKRGGPRQQRYIPQITRVLNEHRHAAGWDV